MWICFVHDDDVFTIRTRGNIQRWWDTDKQSLCKYNTTSMAMYSDQSDWIVLNTRNKTKRALKIFRGWLSEWRVRWDEIPNVKTNWWILQKWFRLCSKIFLLWSVKDKRRAIYPKTLKLPARFNIILITNWIGAFLCLSIQVFDCHATLWTLRWRSLREWDLWNQGIELMW